MSLSTSSVRAVSMMTYASVNVRSCRHTSMPSMPGSIRSSTTTSGAALRAAASAASPSAAVSTVYPSCCR